MIAGVRPEHFEDADVEPDRPGLKFTAPASVVESMGSEVYAYFDVEHGQVESTDLTDLAADVGMEDLARRRLRAGPRTPVGRQRRAARPAGQPGARHGRWPTRA